MPVKLAIVSPAQNAYSETFIQAHRDIPGTVASFYYQGSLPAMLESKGPLQSFSIKSRIIGKIRRTLINSNLSAAESALVKSFKKEKIECVLAEYGPTGVAVMNACRMLRLPLVVHFHGYDASQTKVLEEYGTAYPEMFNYASAVIAVSRVMENSLERMGCAKDKLVYNPCGPNDLYFKIVPAFEQKLLVGIGRFVDKKAPFYTILAFAQVLKFLPDARLIMAGDGPLLQTCENLVRHFKLDKQVHFPGIISPERFREYLGNASAFVQHSITAEDGDMEGTPVGVMEASAAGLPVISTCHAGIPDVIIDGETGLLVKEHDVDGMANNMIKILNDNELAKKLGAAGRENIRNNFSLDKHLNILAKVIEGSLKSR